MPKTVLLVGAGATLAEAVPRNPSRIWRPPLDDTFLDYCRLANLQDLRTLRRYLLNHHGLDVFAQRQSMEEVFNLLYSDVFTDERDDEPLKSYWTLLRMYRLAIGRTTNWLSARSRNGVAALIKRLWPELAHDELTIITFNQDLIIEKALEHLASSRKLATLPWDLGSCYEMEFKAFLYLAQEPFFRSRDGASVRILKLHGSLNWFYLARSPRDARNAIRKPGKELYCINSQRVLEGPRFRPNKRTMHMLPLIVPPIYEKSSAYRQPLGGLWAMARQAVTEADRLIVFGYSFPTNDFAARSLFRSAFHSSGMREVTVIDTSPRAAGRISSLLNADRHSYYKSVGLMSQEVDHGK